MWNVKDSNKQVAFFIKTQSFQKHLINLHQIKCNTNIHNYLPWKPSFSLSKSQNRYIKEKNNQVNNENVHLARKISNIHSNPNLNTANELPFYVPSNKQNYKNFKLRQRFSKTRERMKQNSQIFSRICMASTSYDKNRLKKSWQESQTHRKIIKKQQKYVDYREQAAKSLCNSRLSYSINFEKSFTKREGQKNRKLKSSQKLRQTVAGSETITKFKKIY